jgi:HTH-type transcriptional regulator / antitoxin HigA
LPDRHTHKEYDTLKYTIIKTKLQYKEYTNILEQLVASDMKTKGLQDEIDLLTLLIEK